jgi:hypothetical protein
MLKTYGTSSPACGQSDDVVGHCVQYFVHKHNIDYTCCRIASNTRLPKALGSLDSLRKMTLGLLMITRFEATGEAMHTFVII